MLIAYLCGKCTAPFSATARTATRTRRSQILWAASCGRTLYGSGWSLNRRALFVAFPKGEDDFATQCKPHPGIAAGNLPRPDYLDELMRATDEFAGQSTSRLPRLLADRHTPDRRRIDIVNDGEYASSSHGGYMRPGLGYSRTFDGTVT